MIKNGIVVTGDTGYFTDQVVEITDGVITFVGWPYDYLEPAVATVIDATGMTVMPGIVDAYIGGADFNPSDSAGLAVREAFVMSGVTSACIVGNSLEAMDSFEPGPFVNLAPVGRAYSSGPELARTNAWTPASDETSPIYDVESASEIAAAIADIESRGGNFASISFESVQDPSELDHPITVFNELQLEQIVIAAHYDGLVVRASFLSDNYIDEILTSPVDVLNFTPSFRDVDGKISPNNPYSNVFMAPPRHQILQVFIAAQKIVDMRSSAKLLVPMITTMDERYPWRRPAPLFEPRRSLYEEVVEFYVALGGAVALGSGFRLGEGPGMPMGELLAFQRAGMTSIDILTAATYHAAIACGAHEEVGSLAEGKKGDVIILNGSAVADISALNRVTHVILDGKLVKSP